ncbi:MAG: hypothetical protein ABL888_02965 [Pirellulaceae bacterium]
MGKKLSQFSDIFLSSDLKSFFSRSPRSRENRETERLLQRAHDAFARSRWSNNDALTKFLAGIVMDACEKYDLAPSSPLGDALVTFVYELAGLEPFFRSPPSVSIPDLTLEDASELRSNLHRQLKFLSEEEQALQVWRDLVIEALTLLLDALPSTVFRDYDERGLLSDDAPRMEVGLSDLLYQPHATIEFSLASLYTDSAHSFGLFKSTRTRLDRNIYSVSGIDPDHHENSSKKIIGPSQRTDDSTHKVVETFCTGTPFKDLFSAPVPFYIPFPCRFEHTHVVGGSGHGKTQLLQFLIAHDLAKAKEDQRSIIVIDSQGDLIRTIAGLSCFDPDDPDSLADRLLIVDPTDVEFPASLNMFDWNRGRVEALKPLDRERLLNGTVELYEYLFGSLLGAELTQRQNVIFKYLARLMMEIPNATIQTLRELMENGDKFRPYMEKLPGSARAFFETRFFERSFNETKKQILTRLWGVLSNATFERMFSHERNKVDIFEAMSTGKIVLINTAKELLTHDGAAIFGRFFIAMIAQAALQRSSLQPHERAPAFVYIDEAQDYFDDKIGHLLNQARKYRVGLVLAHQNLDQLSLGLRSTIMASTSIKLAGGVSAKDARVLADDMRCDTEFLQSMKKGRDQTQFACFVRNFTPQAVQVSVPLGYVDRLPKLSPPDVLQLMEANRRAYCAPIADVNRLLEGPVIKAPTPAAAAHTANPGSAAHEMEEHDTSLPQSEEVVAKRQDVRGEIRPASKQRASSANQPIEMPAPVTPGKGGRQHKYLQHLTKGLAEQLGFKAVVEERILNGAGQVDVALYRDDLKIACEISITTGSDQELRNIEKCFAAGFSRVILIADESRHLASLRKAIVAELDEAIAEQVTFCVATDLSAILQAGAPQMVEQTVRGYRVRVKSGKTNDADTATRRKAIAEVIARSLTKSSTR